LVEVKVPVVFDLGEASSSVGLYPAGATKVILAKSRPGLSPVRIGKRIGVKGEVRGDDQRKEETGDKGKGIKDD
jgi:hypothetical protein